MQRVDRVLACERALAVIISNRIDPSANRSARASASALNLFRRQISSCSQQDAGQRGGAVPPPRGFRRELRDAEIQNLGDAGAGEKHVLRLEITMHQAGAVCGDESPGDLCADSPDLDLEHGTAIQPLA